MTNKHLKESVGSIISKWASKYSRQAKPQPASSETDVKQPKKANQQEPQNQQQPEKEQQIQIPADWKPEKGITVQLKNNKNQLINYRVSSNRNWVGPDNNPVKKDLIPTLNLEAYKQELQKKSQQPTAPIAESLVRRWKVLANI